MTAIIYEQTVENFQKESPFDCKSNGIKECEKIFATNCDAFFAYRSPFV